MTKIFVLEFAELTGFNAILQMTEQYTPKTLEIQTNYEKQVLLCSEETLINSHIMSATIAFKIN